MFSCVNKVLLDYLAIDVGMSLFFDIYNLSET